MITYGTKSDKRKKINGEVFAPPGVVFYMIMNVNELLTDIQSDNVEQTRAHMLNTFCDVYKYFTGEKISKPTLNRAIQIIADNFQVGDSLEFMKVQSKPQQILLDWR